MMSAAAVAEDDRSEPGAVFCQVSLRGTHSTESNGVCMCVCVCVCVWGGGGGGVGGGGGGGGGGDYWWQCLLVCAPYVSVQCNFGNMIA